MESQKELIEEKEWKILIILDACRYDFFSRIYLVDVWDFGWDDDVGGVPPAKVTKNLRHSLAKNPRNKFIAHFNQPHIPYLSLELTQEMNTESEALKRARKGIAKKKNFVSSIRHFIGQLTRKVIGISRTEGIRKRLNLREPGIMEAVVEKYGAERLKNAYMNNLELALKEIKNTFNRLPEKIVENVIITADHGDMLGEKGIYGHGHNEYPSLREVPWLEVEG